MNTAASRIEVRPDNPLTPGPYLDGHPALEVRASYRGVLIGTRFPACCFPAAHAARNREILGVFWASSPPPELSPLLPLLHRPQTQRRPDRHQTQEAYLGQLGRVLEVGAGLLSALAGIQPIAVVTVASRQGFGGAFISVVTAARQQAFVHSSSSTLDGIQRARFGRHRSQTCPITSENRFATKGRPSVPPHPGFDDAAKRQLTQRNWGTAAPPQPGHHSHLC